MLHQLFRGLTEVSKSKVVQVWLLDDSTNVDGLQTGWQRQDLCIRNNP